MSVHGNSKARKIKVRRLSPEEVYKMNAKKAHAARTQRPPADFGAAQMGFGINEVLTPAHHSIESWRKQKEKSGVENPEWAKEHPGSEWVLRHANTKSGKYKRGDVYRGPGTYKKMLSILRAEKSAGE
jgi:hypothetical protein